MATDEQYFAQRQWYERKTVVMESVLGKEHGTVMHAIIPYEVGGALDLYYFPDGIPGVAIATKELSEAEGSGPANSVYSCYEFVMFTKRPLALDDAQKPETPFGRIHTSIDAILNALAPFSAAEVLNPHDTCEFPTDWERVGGASLIFDAYGPPPGDIDTGFGLMAAIAIFRSEMDYARDAGGAELLNVLKAAGYYPYSDLDRDPVV